MRIYDGRKRFYQWDLNQKITSPALKVGEEVHFTNVRQTKALTVVTYLFNGKVVADVPNILLQSSYPITVYRYIKQDEVAYTIEEYSFEIEQRPKPDDYIYTETELLTITELVDHALEEAKASGEFDGKDGKDGRDGVDGKDGKDGEPYVLTEADKTAIVNEVLASLPNGDEVSY